MPVRICDPCKKLEEAARFESRYGHRNKVSKVAGSSKSNPSIESDSLLKELLGHDLNTKGTELIDEVSELIAPKHVRSISTGELDKAGDDGLPSTQVTPEMLLLQAQEEKKQWLALKKEGKGEEALLAFKRGKELERQAENLKLSLRRSQRKATTLTSRKEKHEEINKLEPRRRTDDSISGNTQSQGDNGVFQKKEKGTGLKERKEKKDDLLEVLKEMGWNDADLQEAGGKQSKAKTVENELAELAAAVHQGNNSNHQANTSSMQVLAHKRRALALKREGHLAEAKEELKKAKLMERQLEEQQMFGGEDEESDEELRALIHGMDKESSTHSLGVIDMDFSILGNIDHEEDEGMEVTDVDMDDPEMVAALRSMGWEEEAAQMEKTFQRASAKPSNPSHDCSTSFHGIRKSQKPAVEHVDFLGSMEASLNDVEATEDDMKDPFFLSALKAMGFEEEAPSKLINPSIPNLKDKKTLQQEVLFLKKEALVLKRAGKLQEAKEELRQAKQLEKELKDFESQNNEEDILAAFSVQQPSHGHEAEANMLQHTVFPLDEDAGNVDVTEEDMGDPELVKTLKSLGWQDDQESEDCLDTEKEAEPYEQGFLASHKSKTKSELQKELLGVKRAALKLRREGKGEEAEDELKKAYLIEQLLDESGRVSVNKEAQHASEQTVDGILNTQKIVTVSKPGTEDPNMLASLEVAEFKMDGESLILSSSSKQTEKPSGERINNVYGELVDDGWQRSSGMEVKSQKLSATSSVRAAGLSSIPDIILPERTENILEGEGNLSSVTVVRAAVGENLEKGPYVSPHIAEVTAQVKEPAQEKLSSFDKDQDTPASVIISTITAVSSTKASQQEVLALKRQALALKREGRPLEAKEKLREAKLLEMKLASEHTHSESSAIEVQLTDKKVEVETRPPPAISAGASSKQVCTSSSATVQKSTAGKDRMKLQQESLAHKRKALALRREGNTEAADMEFELAKSIEKQMEELGGTTEGRNAMPREDDTGSIDDVFDPQLLAALKGLGWKESDILRPTPEVRQEAVEKPQKVNRKEITEVTSGPNRPNQNNERERLEEKIKSEKIRAVQLKRSGQQSEALNVLRGAKLLENKLQSMN